MNHRVQRLAAIIVFAAATMLGTTSSVAIGAGPPWSGEEQTASSAKLANAIGFRASYGLRSDVNYVTRSLDDVAAFPNDSWGAPLTLGEAVEIARRQDILTAKGPAVELAMNRKGYASGYMDHLRGGVLVFEFAGETVELSVLAALLPPGTELEVRKVERSLGQLQATKSVIRDRVEGLLVEGIEVNSIGIDPVRNAVIVGLESPTDAIEARLVAEFGPGLTFRQQSPAVDDACISVSDCWPPKGGFDITAVQTANRCTSGWIVKRTDQSGTRQILTAGHCIFVGGGNGAAWKHGSSGPGIGDGQSNTWVGSGTHKSDVGLVGIVTTKVPPVRNQFIWGLSGGPLVSAATATRASNLQWVGDGVCRFGITSYRDCGQIVMEDVARKSCINLTNCKWIDRTWEVNIDSQGGDSGGPIYFNTGSSPYLVYGTHVHSDDGPYDPGPNGRGWYSPFNIGRDEYFGITGVYYNLCLTAAC